MCTYFQVTTDMTMTTMTEGLQQKQTIFSCIQKPLADLGA